MREFFGKNRKNVIVAALVAVIVFVSVFGTYTIYAATNNNDQFLKDCDYNPAKDDNFQNPFSASIGFVCLRWKYHKQMNQYFNYKMDRLVDILQKEDFYADPAFNPPTFDQAVDSNIKPYDLYTTKLRAVCKNIPSPSDVDTNPKDDNASSYCVSMGALEIYTSYVEALNQVKKELPKESELVMGQQNYDAGNSGENSKNLFTSVTLDSISGKIATRDTTIDKEIDIAGQTMEAAVATYDEFRTAYPMHRWYEIIIKDLVKYKNKLMDVRRLINLFPGKFINATSKSCQ